MPSQSLVSVSINDKDYTKGTMPKSIKIQTNNHIAEAHSVNIVKGKNCKLILLQNIKGLPAKSLYTVSKPIVNTNKNIRIIEEKTPWLESTQKAGKRLFISVKKRKEGIYELSPEANSFSIGEYIINNHY